ncbi:polypeptide N-acetylgalactosaminyltransferase 9 [Biomphalaria pfeifferi]|uniref:Polypeptide N-acetylgalactosaminyltransferase n=1 Tax=Biomphalaria pfeifferi TaxID=112525 RepID=A0AAD8ASE6_BIOPF|nr:polypeptide N-acetylgalactosaminyltransferase 9 [Biomphalaria pfeifferi]
MAVKRVKALAVLFLFISLQIVVFAISLHYYLTKTILASRVIDQAPSYTNSSVDQPNRFLGHINSKYPEVRYPSPVAENSNLAFDNVTQTPGKVSLTLDKVTQSTDKVPNSTDCCIKVEKKKLFLDVEFPPFVNYGQPEGPGEGGSATTWPANSLTKEDIALKDKDYTIHFFDEWTSRKIAVHRSLPDDRRPECRMKYSNLPAASVTIVFHNEAWTTLLRSIHSVLDRTPIYLLQEIVLLDDFSDMDHLKKPLEAYIQSLEKVQLFRSTKRLGLIRARNTAFEYTKGEIVIFLDSHIECFPGWIEPLLAPIANDSSVIIFPTIEMINQETFATKMTLDLNRDIGGLTVSSMYFKWMPYLKSNTTTPELYYQSPTMPGGLYAVSRDWFSKIGKYDPEMDLWGGENIEISFKTWMCGGSLLLSLCSHVGHVYRFANPTLHGVRLTLKNSVRVAEVWMDQYKHFFYEKLGYNIPEYGDVRSRVRLRQSLKCSNFSTYLDKVDARVKERMDVNGVYFGQIASISTTLCLHRNEHKGNLQHCSIDNFDQMWQFRTDQRITSREHVLGVKIKGRDRDLIFYADYYVIDEVLWVYDDHQRLQNKKTGMCLQANGTSMSVQFKQCSDDAVDQKWKMMTRKEYKELMKAKGVNIDWNV